DGRRNLRVCGSTTSAARDSGIHSPLLEREVWLNQEGSAAVGRCGNINQTRNRVVRHGGPIMRAAIRREYRDAFVVVVVMRVRIHDRPPGFRIDTFGPIHLSKRL